MRSEWNNFSKESDQKKSFVHFLAKISSKTQRDQGPATSHTVYIKLLQAEKGRWDRRLLFFPLVKEVFLTLQWVRNTQVAYI